MDRIVRMFDGHDLIVPRQALEELGIKPGDYVLIHPANHVDPVDLAPEERDRRLRVLDALWGAWTAEDEAAFEDSRREMWNTWPTRS